MREKIALFSGFAIILFLGHHFDTRGMMPYFGWLRMTPLLVLYFFN